MQSYEKINQHLNKVVKADSNEHMKIPNSALGPKAHLINCSFFSKNQDWGKEMKKVISILLKKNTFYIIMIIHLFGQSSSWPMYLLEYDKKTM
jgi:hypothetical protein